MNKNIKKLLILFAAMLSFACQSEDVHAVGTDETLSTMKIQITINGVTRTATLADNSSARALFAELERGNIVYEAQDYGGFEKVGDMGRSFPQNNEPITTVPGDLILYQGDNLCIYYGRNSWNFTRIGRLDNMTESEIRTFVNAGGGNVTVMLSAVGTSSVRNVETDTGRAKAKCLDAGRIVINGRYDAAGITRNNKITTKQ